MSRKKNHLGSFLGRLLLPGLVALLVLLSPALVRADAITTFVVSGTAKNTEGGTLGSCANGATCVFSGVFQVDTTTGTLVSGSFDVTFPGVPTYDSVFASFDRNSSEWQINVSNSSADTGNLIFIFTTAPTPGSLVGFTGGSIVGVPVGFGSYLITSGTITPAPEPSSLVLFTSGLLVLGLARRFRKKVGHSLGA